MRFKEVAAIALEIKIHPKIDIREWFIPPLDFATFTGKRHQA